MAYTPTNWNCGDVITAEKLNKLENGLADCCGGGTEPAVYHYIDMEHNSTADLEAFIQANYDKPFYVNDDDYGFMQTVATDTVGSIVALNWDGAVLQMLLYRADGEHPTEVNRGFFTIIE